MTAKVHRNDPCPCGSGKKSKLCHDGRPIEGTPEAAVADKRVPMALAVIAVLLSIAVGVGRGDLGSGVVVLISCALAIGGFMVLRKPPPSNPSSGAPGGINFGG